MKIHIEADSTQELLDFIKDFAGTTPILDKQVVIEIPTTPEEKEAFKEEMKKPEEESKAPGIENPVKEVKIPDKEQEEEPKEEIKITKEMVRAVFTRLIKAGKQTEAKTLTAKYGASKLPELKEEHYAAVYKEAEGLL